MYLPLLLFLDILFICCGGASSVIVSPSGYQHVKSNVQILCTDDFREAVQPQWISPSNTIIGEFEQQRANCEAAEPCNYEFGEYCENAFASCVDGRCVCQKFGFDPCTCLVSLGDCHMIRENTETIAVATLKNNDSPQHISCESKKSTRTEVHVIAMKYGIASPEVTNVNVNILNRNISTDKAVVLVLVSDRLVFWKVNIQDDERIHRLVLLSRYQDEDNLICMGSIDAIHKPKDAPYGIGDDAEYGGKTVDMLLYLEEKYGQVSSFTGTYTADTWNITIDLTKSIFQADTKHSTVIFTEKVLPWKTKLSIVGLKNDDDYGTYICRGKNSQRNVTIIQKEPISLVAAQRQNVTFRESGVISCKVVGRPTPEVIWKVNGKPINESSKHAILEDGSLRINNVVQSDAGEYICRGFQRKTGDSRTKSIEVTIMYEIPAAPLIWLLDEDIESRKAKIHINSSNSLDVFPGFHYILFFNDNNLTVSGSVSLIIDVKPLTPSTVYNIYGVAVSEGGTSESSNHIEFETNADENSKHFEGSLGTQRRIEITCGIDRCSVSDVDCLTWKSNRIPLIVQESACNCTVFHNCIQINDVDDSDVVTYKCIGHKFSSPTEFQSFDIVVILKVNKSKMNRDRASNRTFRPTHLKVPTKYRARIWSSSCKRSSNLEVSITEQP